ncbi:hypothetical protein T02_16089 [Trichinella nativa]|uniref:Uncharacterized protein n=1 Tax=Trichinella nativa TaxID=6335 RepID=A0A0V1LEW9_9BILA|nr:hypothetical protein T02_16089 [Trichinella nativa]
MHVYVRGIILERRAGLKCASSRPVVQLEADVCMCGCFSEILNCLGGQTLRRIVWVCQCPVCACLPSVLCSVCPCFELAERIISQKCIPERKSSFSLASVQF